MLTPPLKQEAVTLSGKTLSGAHEVYYRTVRCAGVADADGPRKDFRRALLYACSPPRCNQAPRMLTYHSNDRTTEMKPRISAVSMVRESPCVPLTLMPPGTRCSAMKVKRSSPFAQQSTTEPTVAVRCGLDTISMQLSRGAYELVVSMYGDRGHIPMKLLNFERTITGLLGISLIRTSVDHGSGFILQARSVPGARNIKAALRIPVIMPKRQIPVSS